MPVAIEMLSSWNEIDVGRLQNVKIEEDIRDALQSVGVTRPSIAQRKALLDLSDKVGVQFAFLGFPAASLREEEQCGALAAHAAEGGLSVLPVFMARAAEADIPAICRVQEKAGAAVAADIFIAVSDIRFHVEGWTLAGALDSLRRAAALAQRDGLQIRISLEDASRASAESLTLAVSQAIELGATAITLCDTVGDCTPSGARRLAAFGRDLIDARGTDIDIGWHGHNDKGLALANALAAAEGGASIISGTFLGVGERTGNIPLEQAIYHLVQAGNGLYDLRSLAPLCALLCKAAQIRMPENAPLVGPHAFATSTGTHAAAIHKGRALGADFEDLVYSGVRAADLGRSQSILIGPNSGRRAVRALLEEISIAPSPQAVTQLLRYCKTQECSFDSAEAVREVLSLTSVEVEP